MSQHSNLVGGSSAARFLNCPGSRAIIESLPDAVDRPSIYATEGSAVHQVIAELLLDFDLSPQSYLDRAIVVKDEGSITITQELIHDCILPALSWFENVIPETAHFEVEKRVVFPGIAGAFGTCDLIAHDPISKRTFVNDWKFGGIPVRAAYSDPNDPQYEILNAQLMFYACAARATFPNMFPNDCTIELSIVQPRSRGGDPVSTATVSHADLDSFVTELQNAVKLSEQPNAPLSLGDHCRFAVCKTHCPLHLAPMIDFANLYAQPGDAVNVRKFATSDVLADIMNLAERIEPVITEARRQAHDLLEAGGTIPGWKLVPKRANRKWALDEFLTLKALRKLRVKKSQAFSYTLKSPAQIEKILPRGESIPESLIDKVSSGTTVAKADDPRDNAGSIGDILNEIVAGQGESVFPEGWS